MSRNILLAGALGVVVAVLLVWRMASPPPPPPRPAPTAAPTVPPPVRTNEAVPLPASTPSSSAAAPASAVPLEAAMLEAKKLEDVRVALRAGDPKKALAELESYDRVVREGVLRHEATLLRVEALAGSGRRTDALALAMRSRDDPSFAPYKDRLEAVLADAGL